MCMLYSLEQVCGWSWLIRVNRGSAQHGVRPASDALAAS